MPTTQQPAPTAPRRGRWLRVPVVLTLLVAVSAVVLRSPSPVGHWRSAHGHAAFTAAYHRAFADLPPPAVTLDVRTDWGVVRVYRFAGADPRRADAPPLVLLPGTASASPVWADNLPTLLRIADVYTVDLLGEPGLSVQERPIQTDADQAAWLHQTLAALPEPRVHLIGLSIGGWTAANLAIHRPERLASVTLIDPAVVLDDIPVQTVLRSVPASVPWLPRSWRDDFASYTAGGAPVDDLPVAAMIEAGMQHYALALPAPTRPSPDTLAAVRIPTQVIIAGRSVMHDPPTATRNAVAAFGEDAVHLYPNASHALNGEEPDRIAADIASFVARHR